MTRPTVEVISLGGTIAMSDGHGSGVSLQLTAEDLVAAVPELDEQARLQAWSFRQLPGAHLHEDDLIDLSTHIRASLRDRVTGVVVTQGTDTIDETAFLLDLLLDVEAPVVVTGAMRAPSEPGADGPANLRSAVQVASAPVCRGLGTLVVLNDEIHAARLVRKSDTFRPNAFRSLAGPLGWVAEGEPQILLRPAEVLRLPSAPSQPAQPVALVTVAFGDAGSLLRQCPSLGYRGIVVEALGVGHVPQPVAHILHDLATEMPVVLTSRTAHGPLFQSTYRFTGSERDLLTHGLIHAGYLDGPKARVLLSLLLRTGAQRDEIAEFFHRQAGAVSGLHPNAKR